MTCKVDKHCRYFFRDDSAGISPPHQIGSDITYDQEINFSHFHLRRNKTTNGFDDSDRLYIEIKHGISVPLEQVSTSDDSYRIMKVY